MNKSFELLKSKVNEIEKMTFNDSSQRFLKEEVFRFISIGGTIGDSFKNIDTNINERIISHILFRSLFENFFRIMYIFDEKKEIKNRFNECLNGFKKEYYKLYNEPNLAHKSELEQPLNNNWKDFSCKSIKDMLVALKNNYGDRLDYIYFIYRITSFDTHGNTLKSLFDESFQKNCNFPYLKLDIALEMISSEYLEILNNKLK